MNFNIPMENKKLEDKKSKKQEYKVKYVYSTTPDAEERVNRAFDILFKNIDLYK